MANCYSHKISLNSHTSNLFHRDFWKDNPSERIFFTVCFVFYLCPLPKYYKNAE